MSRTILVLAVLSLLAASPALALPGEAGKVVQVGIGGGVSLPVSHAKDALKNGFHVRGILEVKPPVFPLGLRGALGYQKFDLEHAPLGTTGSGNILSGMGGITIGMSLGPIRPYVTASLGAFRVETKMDSTGTETSAHETKFGIDGGAGVQFKLASMHGFVEARIENVYTDQGFDTSFLEKNSTRIIPVTFGLMF
ncbi:MAG TPA: outer membrane beta-barrel protein [Candidatus Eisenbacteria bacterium]|nr:outer membrane beta-barrel protein [Candidatus Eisenbacteria bacterium]